MSEIQWFSLVILPGVLIVIVFVAARLFERMHPIPNQSAGHVRPLRPEEVVFISDPPPNAVLRAHLSEFAWESTADLRIDIRDELDIQYWTKVLRVSREELKEAVKKAGSSAGAVRKELTK